MSWTPPTDAHAQWAYKANTATRKPLTSAAWHKLHLEWSARRRGEPVKRQAKRRASVPAYVQAELTALRKRVAELEAEIAASRYVQDTTRARPVQPRSWHFMQGGR